MSYGLAEIITLFDILHQAECAEKIGACWGEVPLFTYVEILHLKHTIIAGMGSVSILAIFATCESDDLNECKPSKMIIDFRDVSRFEFVDAFGDHPAHGIKLDTVFTSESPSGVLSIDTCDGSYIACRSVWVISCIRDPFTMPKATLE
jgi:hypothetical protein